VASDPTEAGFPATVGAVAPFGCTLYERGIVLLFADLYGSGTRIACEVAAQSLAESFGLDNEHHCPDVMSTLSACGDKSFTDHDARCGQDSERDCLCGMSTQNSHRMLLDLFGPTR